MDNNINLTTFVELLSFKQKQTLLKLIKKSLYPTVPNSTKSKRSSNRKSKSVYTEKARVNNYKSYATLDLIKESKKQLKSDPNAKLLNTKREL